MLKYYLNKNISRRLFFRFGITAFIVVLLKAILKEKKLYVDNLLDFIDNDVDLSLYHTLETKRYGKDYSSASGAIYRILKYNSDIEYNKFSNILLNGNTNYYLQIHGVTDFSQLGLRNKSIANQNHFDVLDSHSEVNLNLDLIIDDDVFLEKSNFSIQGNGSFNILPGKKIIVTGDKLIFDVKVFGNYVLQPTIKNLDFVNKTVSFENKIDLIPGDQFSLLSNDISRRAKFTGSISRIVEEGFVFGYEINPIDGNDEEYQKSDVIRITQSKNSYVSLTFQNCKNIYIGDRFNNSSVDLILFNVDSGYISDVTIFYSNCLIQFSNNISINSFVSDGSRFYGLSIQGSNDISIKEIYVMSPGFSGFVLKGVENLIVKSIYLDKCPVMSIQLVDYPGVSPSSVRSELNSGLTCSNIKIRSLLVNKGNWIASIKNSFAVQIEEVISNQAYKSFFFDINWNSIIINKVTILQHGYDDANNIKSRSSNALLIQNGSNLYINYLYVDYSYQRVDSYFLIDCVEDSLITLVNDLFDKFSIVRSGNVIVDYKAG